MGVSAKLVTSLLSKLSAIEVSMRSLKGNKDWFIELL